MPIVDNALKVSYWIIALNRPNDEKMMPKNRAENIYGILRCFSTRKPCPSEKAKVTPIKRKTYSTVINL